VVLLAAPQHQCGLELLELGVIGGGRRLGEGGGRPADRLDLGDLQAELAGEDAVAAVVVAATAAGVPDAAGLGEAVGGLVQQRAQDLQGAAVEAFAADQDLVAVGAGDLPAASRASAA
jgi:hypothetical protein